MIEILVVSLESEGRKGEDWREDLREKAWLLSMLNEIVREINNVDVVLIDQSSFSKGQYSSKSRL